MEEIKRIDADIRKSIKFDGTDEIETDCYSCVHYDNQTGDCSLKESGLECDFEEFI